MIACSSYALKHTVLTLTIKQYSHRYAMSFMLHLLFLVTISSGNSHAS